MGDLDKIRLIILLEMMRKLYTFLITKKITKVLTEHKILTGLNWAGLLGGKT